MSGLGSYNIVAFVNTSNPERAKAFYMDQLGLSFVSQDSFAVVFNANGITLRVGIAKQVIPAPHTVLGWEAPDIAQTIRDLNKAGVKFERFPGLPQDDLGIWSAPGGAKVAWFKDPDGNVLSVSQH